MAALVNHDCRPNSAMTYHGTLLTIRAVRDIAVGEEITINYSPVRLADCFLPGAACLVVGIIQTLHYQLWLICLILVLQFAGKSSHYKSCTVNFVALQSWEQQGSGKT